MKRALSITWAIIILTLLGCNKEDNGPTAPSVGTITGKITDATSQLPIANAIISTNPYSTLDTTDVNGDFRIVNAAPGEYTVKATKSGYNTDSLTISVTAGNISNADIALMRSVSGRWEQTFTLSGTTFVGYYNLVQNGTSLTGDFVFDDGSGYTTISSSSSINGNSISIIWYLEAYKLTFSGTVSNDFNSMNGSLYLNNTIYACPWTARRISNTGKVARNSLSLTESSKTLLNILSSSH